MKTLLILLCLAGCASPAVPTEDSHVFTLTEEQMQTCNEQGGCVVISRAKAMELMREVRDEAIKGCGGDMKHSESFNLKGQT